jgi:DUF4097 and DUF4098 domain-containing protein YvlB
MSINETLYPRIARTSVAGSSTLLAAMVVAAIAGAAPALRAQESTDSKAFSWSGKIPVSSWIRIKNLNGDIEVVASEGSTVEVTAEKRWDRGNPADVRFEILKDGDNVTICALWDNFREAYCDEDSYNHRGNSSRRDDVHVYFKVKLPKGVRVLASAVNGSVDISGARAQVKAGSVNGEVVVSTSTGPVSASSVNGSVRVNMESLESTEAMSFSSINGSVSLTLPASFDAELNMSTVNGRVRSDFPITLEGRIDPRRMRGTIGKGGRQVKLSTVNGNIELRKS